PHALYLAAAVASSGSSGGPPSASGDVLRPSTLEATSATPTCNNRADFEFPAVYAQALGTRREIRSTAQATGPDGFTLVQRKRRSPASTGTGRPENVLAVPRRPSTKAIFVSTLSPMTTVSDIEDLVTPLLDNKPVTVTKLQPKFNSYSSFHLSGDQSVFDSLN
ncbi:hypothetical protein HPB47_017737, partial [Ixodes persulcatus]